jgi:hypothetical protein
MQYGGRHEAAPALVYEEALDLVRLEAVDPVVEVNCVHASVACERAATTDERLARGEHALDLDLLLLLQPALDERVPIRSGILRRGELM